MSGSAITLSSESPGGSHNNNSTGSNSSIGSPKGSSTPYLVINTNPPFFRFEPTQQQQQPPTTTNANSSPDSAIDDSSANRNNNNNNNAATTTDAAPRFDYDETTNWLTMVAGNKVTAAYISPARLAGIADIRRHSGHLDQLKHFEYSDPSVDNIICAKITENRSHIAYQTNSDTIVFCDLRNEEKWVYSCRVARGKPVTLLGFYWFEEKFLVIITTTAIELYKLHGSKKGLKSIKTISAYTKWFTFMNPILVVAVEGKNNVLMGYKISSKTIAKMAKICLEAENMTNDDVNLVTMYNQIYMLHINSQRQELSVYRVTKDTIEKIKALNLFSPGTFSVNVVDSLLVVHNFQNRISMLYDIKSKSIYPLAPPMSIGFDQAFVRQKSSEGKDMSSVNFYDRSRFVFFSARMVVDYQQGCVFQLALNINALPLTFKDKFEMTQFLFRRRGSKNVLLASVRSAIKEGEKLTVISAIFDLINKAYLFALRRREPLNTSGASPMMASPQQQQQQQPVTQPPAEAQGYTFSSLRDRLNWATSFSKGEHQKAPPSPTGQHAPADTSSEGALGEGIVEAFDDNASAGTDNDKHDISNQDNPYADDDFTSPGNNNTSGVNGSGTATTPTAAPPPPPAAAAAATATALPTGGSDALSLEFGFPVIDQLDLYRFVFCPLEEEEEEDGTTIEYKFFVAVFMEYIRSLTHYRIPVQHYMQKFLIDLLVKNKDYHQLHQFIQYRVINDSIPVALQLYSICEQYKPAYQLCLDMLSRMAAFDQYVEILLSRREIPQALQLMYRYKLYSIRPKHVFEAVVALNDRVLFYNTFEILTKLNAQRRQSPEFLPEDQCDEYIRLFRELFYPAAATKNNNTPNNNNNNALPSSSSSSSSDHPPDQRNNNNNNRSNNQ